MMLYNTPTDKMIYKEKRMILRNTILNTNNKKELLKCNMEIDIQLILNLNNKIKYGNNSFLRKDFSDLINLKRIIQNKTEKGK